MALHLIAEQRKRVKTPPGFKDSGDGDFFIWADILFGLLQLKNTIELPNRLILITNYGKIDWCREGKAHPILFAEAKYLIDIDFEIWTLDKFARTLKD